MPAKNVSFTATGEKKNSQHDSTLFRLIRILTKIADHEYPNSKELAEEFNVSVRTIQIDINQRLSNYPIEKRGDHRYKFMDGFSLNKTALDSDEMILLHLALSQFEEVRDFDGITSRVFKKLISSNFTNPYFVKQEDFEEIEIDSNVVEELEEAIKMKYMVKIDTNNSQKEIEPYKIAAFDGIWYLFGKDKFDNKIKTFMIKKKKKVKLLSKKHTVSHEKIEKVLDRTHSAWYDDGESFEVTVKVHPQISDYFKQKDFLQSQKIDQEFDDGSLIISFEITHDEDIDNMIKSWLPHIEVIEPRRFKDKIKGELQEYLKRID